MIWLFLTGVAVGLFSGQAFIIARSWYAMLAYKRGDFLEFGRRHGMRGAELEKFVRQCIMWQKP